MHRVLSTIFLFVGLSVVAGSEVRAETFDLLHVSTWCSPAYHEPCCCNCGDAYCPKTLPPLPCAAPCGCCDTYCPKPMPCIPCPAPCGCEDIYCGKCWRCPPWCQGPTFRCPPPEETAPAPCASCTQAVSFRTPWLPSSTVK
jgi:hypothetical protein